MNLTGNILDFDMVCDVRVDIFLGSADDGIIGFGCIFLHLSVFGRCVAVHSVDKFRQLAEGVAQPLADLGQLFETVKVSGSSNF